MQCTNCGNQVPDTAKVCGHCGHSLRAASVNQTPNFVQQVKNTESIMQNKKIIPVMVAAGLAILFFVCCAFVVWVDQTYRWCVFLPFLPGCG